jgi:cytochrome P450
MQIFPTREQRRNPYPFYATMRRDQPVAYDEKQKFWAVYRYEDVRGILTDHATFSSDFARRPNSRFANRRRTALISTDPPRHTQLRGLVSRAFTPRAIAMLESRIGEVTNDLLDRVCETGQLDLIEDLASPLPVTVIAEMLGIPAEDRAQFKRWSDQVIGGSDTVVQDDGAGPESDAGARAREQVIDEMDRYFAEIVDQRRTAPRDDLISGLVAAEIDGERLAQEDILAFCVLLLIAGNVTTTNLLGNALVCLLDRPRVLAELRAEPGLIPLAIEEVLRYESPVQATFRTTTRDVEVAGHAIPADQMVIAWTGSANRDEAKFADPDNFDVRRQPNPHVAFGSGIHFCLGAPLTRLEARVALEIIVQRLAGLERADAGPLELTKSFFLHGFTHLPLRFAPSRQSAVAAPV